MSGISYIILVFHPAALQFKTFHYMGIMINNFARETNMCTHFTTSFFNSEFASTFPIPGCCKRPAALKRHGGAGGGEFLMTSLNLVGYWGRSGSCWWCLFFFFPSFCAALHNKVYEISNIRLKIQQ